MANDELLSSANLQRRAMYDTIADSPICLIAKCESKKVMMFERKDAKPFDPRSLLRSFKSAIFLSAPTQEGFQSSIVDCATKGTLASVLRSTL
jgi:hypothetical protein